MILLNHALAIVVLAASGQVDGRHSLMLAALDQTTQLLIEKQALAEALATVLRETGVDVRMDAECFAMLPSGDATVVSAELRNIPLRQGLVELLTPLGMTFEPHASAPYVDVQPMDALVRLGRRATWNELDTLARLARTRWTPGSPELAELRGKLQFADVPEKDPWPALAERIERIGAGKAAEVLTLATEALGWTWYPSDDLIVILPHAKQVERQLDRQIHIQQAHRPLMEVLADLGRIATLDIRVDADAVSALPLETRQNFTLMMSGYPVREALDRVAGTTGLSWRVDGDHVTYSRGANAGHTIPARPADAPDPIVGSIVVPNPNGEGTIQLFIRESDLSPEMRRYRAQMLDDFNRAMTKYLLEHK